MYAIIDACPILTNIKCPAKSMGKSPVGYFLCWIRFSAFVTLKSIIRRTIIQLIFIVGYFTSQLAVELMRSMNVNFTRIIKICSHLMECNRGHVAVQFILFLRLVLPTRVCKSRP